MGRRRTGLPFSAATLPKAFSPDTVPSLTGLPSSVSFHSSNRAGIRNQTHLRITAESSISLYFPVLL